MTLKTLLIKEFMAVLLDRKYLVYFILVAVLAVAGFTVRAGVYRDKHDNYKVLENSFAQDAQNAKGIYPLAMGGLKVALPPEPMQALAAGAANHFSEFCNITLSFWGNEPYPFLRTEKYTNPALGIFPALDIPMLVLFVVSLMVLVFSHATVSRERESGTLRLLLSYRLPRAYVIIAKTVSGYLVTVFPVVFALVCVMLAAQLIPYFHMDARMTALTAVLGSVTLLYLLVLYLLGVFISTVCNRSATAVAVLLLAWLVFIVVVHNAAVLAYEQSAAGVSVARVLREEMQLEKRIGLFGRIEEVRKKVLGLGKDEPINWKNVSIVQNIDIQKAQLQMMNNQVSTTVNGYINDLDKNYRGLSLTGFASPSLLYLQASTDLAGTGITAHIRRLRSMMDYQQRFTDELLAMLDRQREAASQGKPNPGQMDPAAFMEAVGAYRMPHMPLRRVLVSVLPRVLALCMYAVLFFMMGFTAFIKKDVT